MSNTQWHPMMVHFPLALTLAGFLCLLLCRNALHWGHGSLAPSVARWRAIFRIKAHDLGRLHQSVGRAAGPVACIWQQYRESAKPPFSHSRLDCLRRIHCHWLLRRRERLPLWDRRARVCVSLTLARASSPTLECAARLQPFDESLQYAIWVKPHFPKQQQAWSGLAC
jgi:hypothetical protein